jgi:hypothetical protein
LQRFGWDYYYLLLNVPIGICAAFGIDELVSAFKERNNFQNRISPKIIFLICLSLIFAAKFHAFARKSIWFTKFDFAINEQADFQYKVKMDGYYGEIDSNVNFLKKDAKTDEIYVFGNPLYYYLSKCEPAIPYYATWFLPTKSIWENLIYSLKKKKPLYIFVEHDSMDEMRRISDFGEFYHTETYKFLESDYNNITELKAGSWFQRK